MTAKRKIRDFVIANAGRQYCDDCLSSALQIKPRQQVQQKTSALAGVPSFRRALGICSRCQSNKVVIEALGLGPHEKAKPNKPGDVQRSAARVDRSRSTDSIDLAGALVLVSCVKSKQSQPAPARELYTSAWFRGVRDLIEAGDARWFILSALHGLVHPDAVIAAYDHTLNSLGIAERRAWAKKVLDKLLPETEGYPRVVIFAGQRYREFLVKPLESRGIVIDTPMERLRLGEQLGWLSERA